MLENLLNLENTRKSEKYWEMLENPFSGYETIENLECATHWKMLRVYGTINSHFRHLIRDSVHALNTKYFSTEKGTFSKPFVGEVPPKFLALDSVLLQSQEV